MHLSSYSLQIIPGEREYYACSTFVSHHHYYKQAGEGAMKHNYYS